MRILHTADWHVGKKLERYPRLDEQKEVLNEIAQIADGKEADIVVIAGDLFDNFSPSADAEHSFYRALKRLSAEGRRPVIAIAGNHDSPDRIEVPNPLALENGIFFSGYPHSVLPLIELDTGIRIQASEEGFAEIRLPQYDYPLRLLLTPYANEYRLRQYLGGEQREEALQQLLASKWRTLADNYCDDRGVNMLVAHLFMIKKGEKAGEEPDDEKPILHVGGAQTIPTDAIPDQIQYTALGHLHRYHHVEGAKGPVVYCGSPLCYSFSEAEQEKFVAVVELEPGVEARVERIGLKSGKRLKRLKANGVAEALALLEQHGEYLVELSLYLEGYLSSGDRKTLQECHGGIINIIPFSGGVGVVNEGAAMPDPSENIETLFADYYLHSAGMEAGEELMALFRELRAKKSGL